MISVLKLVFLLVILQLGSAVKCDFVDVGNADGNGDGSEDTDSDLTSEDIDSDLTSGEIKDIAVYGRVTPDPEVCRGVTIDVNNKLIALAPKEVWDKENVQSAICTAKITIRCISGEDEVDEEDELDGCKADAGTITVTIIGYTGSTSDPPMQIYETDPPVYPPGFVLPRDTFYEIAEDTAGAINIAYTWEVTTGETRR